MKSLCQGIDTVAKSNLIEARVLDNIRFVTHDSKNFYIFTRGEHTSNNKFKVKEIIAHLQSEFTNDGFEKNFKESLKNEYTIGRFLVRILEEQIPNFAERKKFVCSVLEHSSKTA